MSKMIKWKRNLLPRDTFVLKPLLCGIFVELVCMARAQHVSSRVELAEIAMPVGNNAYEADPSCNLQAQENGGNSKGEGANIITDIELSCVGCSDFCPHKFKRPLIL